MSVGKDLSMIDSEMEAQIDGKQKMLTNKDLLCNPLMNMWKVKQKFAKVFRKCQEAKEKIIEYNPQISRMKH